MSDEPYSSWEPRRGGPPWCADDQHDWGPWAHTVGHAGTEYRFCNECGAMEQQSVAAAGEEGRA